MSDISNKVFLAIDCETTGLIEGYHEIIQMSMLEINPDTFDPTGVSFEMNIKPLRPEIVDPKALEINGMDITQLMKTALPPGAVRASFCEWKDELFGNRKVYPLGHNFAFDRGFLRCFFGDLYDNYFHYKYRDSAILAQALLDCKIIDEDKLHSTSLGAVADYFNIPKNKQHTATGDALMTTRVYKMMRDILYTLHKRWKDSESLSDLKL
jgi:DNA polymerase III epsilon subunit-like protein